METYRSGDVCERCRWQSKRAIRSGGRRRARANCICEVRCGNGNRIEEATPTPKHSCKMLFWQFNIFYGEVLKWSKRRDSKSRRALTRRVGSNPTFSANKKRTFGKQKFSFCLSKPQAWYIIATRSVVYIIKGGEPPLYLITRQRAFSAAWWYAMLRIDDIPQQVADDIQGYALILVRLYGII